MPANKMCKRILQRICSEAGKRDDSPFCREVARHIESCRNCREQAISLRGTLELYWCLEREEVPKDVSARLARRLGLRSRP